MEGILAQVVGMPFPIENKFVIAVSSSALFDLSESDRVFREQGAVAYKAFQEAQVDAVLNPGVAFPFIRRFLQLNRHFPEQLPVEVVLLSRNSPATGRRVFRSIVHHQLDICRAGFLTGRSPYPYLPAFNASLFLSANDSDVRGAIAAGYAAGLVLPSRVDDDGNDAELRIAFDFDGVIADDESETVFKQGDLQAFDSHEVANAHIPHKPGPLADMFLRLGALNALERDAESNDASYQRCIRTAIITARGAPAHERMITTLESWGVDAHETFFLGGMDKSRVLSKFKPHIFFDDQLSHLQGSAEFAPMVHIPFGIANAEARPD